MKSLGNKKHDEPYPAIQKVSEAPKQKQKQKQKQTDDLGCDPGFCFMQDWNMR